MYKLKNYGNPTLGVESAPVAQWDSFKTEIDSFIVFFSFDGQFQKKLSWQCSSRFNLMSFPKAKRFTETASQGPGPNAYDVGFGSSERLVGH